MRMLCCYTVNRFFIPIAAGSHTITIKNKVALTNSNIDQIVLLGDPATLTTTPGTYQETDVNLTYTGNWIQTTNASNTN